MESRRQGRGPQVFVCYRRSDTGHIAGRLRDSIASKFGSDRVFFDIDSVSYGQDFRGVVNETMARSDVVVVLIGPDWNTQLLHNANDFVAWEIFSAIKHQKLLIPVLVDDAAIPEPSALPEELETLAFRNAAPLRRDPDFHGDVHRLLRAIDQVTPVVGTPPNPVVTERRSVGATVPDTRREILRPQRSVLTVPGVWATAMAAALVASFPLGSRWEVGTSAIWPMMTAGAVSAFLTNRSFQKLDSSGQRLAAQVGIHIILFSAVGFIYGTFSLQEPGWALAILSGGVSGILALIGGAILLYSFGTIRT
ncbi:MAG: toll/interleukin-1 receptor domain-containing protein [bacterium]|nr:toll/interleukin-1 receptor domain-containing protein [bacterium]